MKLEKVETFVVANPPPRHGGHYFSFVRLATAFGVAGFGEIYNATFGPDPCAAMSHDVFERQFVRQSPHHIERLWRQTYRAGFTMRPDVTAVGVLSGLEMACWDSIGIAAGQPIYQLLGGKVVERLRCDTYLYPADGDVYPDPNQPKVYNDADVAAKAAALAVEQGHTADLSFGSNGQFIVSGAKRMARRHKTCDPLWFEKPIPQEHPVDLVEVARHTSIPVAVGERLCSKHEFARILEVGAASILRVNLSRVDGVLEAKKIASMAETLQVQIAPHLYCGPIVAVANIQITTCSPNFMTLESIGRLWNS